MGITLATWKCCGYDKDHDGDIDDQDLRLVTRGDVVTLLRVHYWNRWKANHIGLAQRQNHAVCSYQGLLQIGNLILFVITFFRVHRSCSGPLGRNTKCR